MPTEVISQLKRQASAKHVRYTSYVRSILERAALGGTLPEIAEITERLKRIERAVTSSQTQAIRRRRKALLDQEQRTTCVVIACTVECGSMCR